MKESEPQAPDGAGAAGKTGDAGGIDAAGGSLVADGYDAVYESGPDSPTLQRIWQDNACGPGYPEGFGHISFITVAELHTIATESDLGTGATLVDLACGAGGPGLWISHATGCKLIGLDLSSVGVARAAARAQRLGLDASASFGVGSFAATGLASASVDAVMTVDALQYAPDKGEALDEMARILKVGGRLAITAFEVEPDRVQGLPVLGDDPVDDYRAGLDRAGFTLESYSETPGWLARLEATYQAVLDASDALTAELGPEGYASLSLEVALTLGVKPYRRRVLALAVKG